MCYYLNVHFQCQRVKHAYFYRIISAGGIVTVWTAESVQRLFNFTFDSNNNKVNGKVFPFQARLWPRGWAEL